MEEFNPPINTREDDELIIIANSSTDEWQQSAINQAKTELEHRGILPAQQQMRFNHLKNEAEQAWNEELEIRKVEDYEWYQKIIIVFFWFYVIFEGWGLKHEGYVLKSKRRLQLIVLGVGVWGIMFSWMNRESKIEEQKRIEEIERVDISAWEKNRINSDSALMQPTVEKDTDSNTQANKKQN